MTRKEGGCGTGAGSIPSGGAGAVPTFAFDPDVLAAMPGRCRSIRRRKEVDIRVRGINVRNRVHWPQCRVLPFCFAAGKRWIFACSGINMRNRVHWLQCRALPSGFAAERRIFAYRAICVKGRAYSPAFLRRLKQSYSFCAGVSCGPCASDASCTCSGDSGTAPSSSSSSFPRLK